MEFITGVGFQGAKAGLMKTESYWSKESNLSWLNNKWYTEYKQWIKTAKEYDHYPAGGLMANLQQLSQFIVIVKRYEKIADCLVLGTASP